MGLFCCTITLLLATLGSQDPERPPDLGFATIGEGLRYRAVTVEATGCCAVLAVKVGSDHDPAGETGLAATLAEVLRLRFASLPEALRPQVALRGAATLLAVVRPDGDLAAALAALRDALDPTLQPSDDDIARAKGAAALAADDQSQVFPGPMLYLAAKRTLLRGTPAGRQSVGIPQEIQALTADTIRQWLRTQFRVDRALLVVLAPGPNEAVVAKIHTAFTDLTTSDVPAPTATVHDSLPPASAQAPHERVDAPYVSLALRAPEAGHADWLPFMVAMGVAEQRVARAFREPRGREAAAQARPFFYNAAEGARVVLLTRRGLEGKDLAKPTSELEAVATALHEFGVQPEEVAQAAAALALRLQLPPYPVGVAPLPAHALYPRAMALITTELHGWPADLPQQIGKLALGRVDDVLRRAFAPSERHWFALVPAE